MIEKQVLQNPLEIELALPKDGFSEDFLSSLRNICSTYSTLSKGYILLKKSGGDICIFLCFLLINDIEPKDADDVIESLAKKILTLFTDQIAIDVVCLNGKTKLLESVECIASPFFQAEI